MLTKLNARNRFVLAVIILFCLMTGPFVLAAAMIWLDAEAGNRQLLQQLLLPHLPMGTVLTALGFAMGVLVIRYLFREYVGGLLRMAEHLRLLLDANRHFRIQADTAAPEVRELAEAANALALQRNQMVDSVQDQIKAVNQRVEDEKNRLAALVSDLSQAVVVCNREGKILLYNQRARMQFHNQMAGISSSARIGLGRSIYQFIDRVQIDHALEMIEYRLKQGVHSTHAGFVLTTSKGQFLRVQMVPVMTGDLALADERSLNGYILSLEDITRSFEHEAERDQAFSDLIGQIRGHLVPVRTALQALQTAGQAPEVSTQIETSMGHLQHTLDAGMVAFASVLKSRWPLDEMQVSDVVAAAERRIVERLGLAVSFERSEESHWIRADSYHLVFALYFLADHLQTACEIRSVAFRERASDDAVWLELVWQAQMVSSETVATWELDAMSVGEEHSPLSLREVLHRHGAELRYEREKARHEGIFRLIFPKVAPDAIPQRGFEMRPEYYDFDLFHAHDPGLSGDLLDRPLKDLAYTVFDTETTGLEPSKGDEIIQIGAVRILNNRLLAQETFDQLIDPEFPLPQASIDIHGITDEMVKGQPSIQTVLPVFHDFALDTVLVAHNAAFDMRFLQIKEAPTGVRFAQPVLDTLLLSAVVHPNQPSHALDAIAERLGIQITARHNAMGDAWVTGLVFLKLLPLLADKGVVTLRQALEASEKTYFARVKY